MLKLGTAEGASEKYGCCKTSSPGGTADKNEDRNEVRKKGAIQQHIEQLGKHCQHHKSSKSYANTFKASYLMRVPGAAPAPSPRARSEGRSDDACILLMATREVKPTMPE